MPAELKRRDLSGIYIFDTFPGESKRQPTCIEDCQPETRRKLLLTKSKEWLRDCIEQLAKTFKETTDYLVTEGCVTDEQRKEFFAMIDRNVERSKYNWAEHELLPPSRWLWIYKVLGYRLTLLYDLWHLMRCDGITMLAGWEQSRGARLEKATADIFNIKVITL